MIAFTTSAYLHEGTVKLTQRFARVFTYPAFACSYQLGCEGGGGAAEPPCPELAPVVSLPRLDCLFPMLVPPADSSPGYEISSAECWFW